MKENGAYFGRLLSLHTATLSFYWMPSSDDMRSFDVVFRLLTTADGWPSKGRQPVDIVFFTT